MKKQSRHFGLKKVFFNSIFTLLLMITYQGMSTELLSKPELWLRADRGVKTNNAGQVITWADQSKQKNLVVSGKLNTAPILLKADLNGRPVIVFDGKDDMLRLTSPMSIGPKFTAFMVVYNSFQKTADALYRPVLAGIDAFESNGKSYAFSYTGKNHIFRISNSSKENFADIKLITHKQYDVITINAAHQKLQTYNFEEWFKPIELPSAVSTAKRKYIIGGGAPNAGNYKGRIAEIIIYNRQLNKIELEKVQKYLLEKYFSGSEAPKRDLTLLKKVYFNGKPVKIIAVDVLDRVFPDRIPKKRKIFGPAGTPRNATVFFQFALVGKSDLQCKLKLTTAKTKSGKLFPGTLGLYEAKPVRVEANTQGHEWCVPDGKVPDGWMKFLVRKAPFYVNEALCPTNKIKIKKGTFYSLIIEVRVPDKTKAGIYRSKLIVKVGGKKITAPFSFRVYKTRLSAANQLNSTHWFSGQPSELCSGKPPQWWSPRHWKLIRRGGRTLQQYGDNTMYTILTENRWYGENSPLIKTTMNKDGTFTFDFSRFDKWAKIFYDMGYKYLAGSHLVRTRYWTYVYDQKTGKQRQMWDCFSGDRAERQKQWLNRFIKPFTAALYSHLKAKGWTDKYIQYVYDEAHDAELYKQLSSIVKTNMPGILTSDANNKNPQEYSKVMDILVFNLVNILKHRKLVDQRIKEGKSTWLYHCVSPYPPYPNRHLDSFLTESRLWPWICFETKATGFLYWAANTYQGQNEYESSLGPKGRQKYGSKVYMGYEPGDNWFLYRTADGLVPSMRLLAHKAGTIDYALLKMAQAKDPAFVKRLLQKIVNGVVKKTKKFPKNWSWRRFPEQINYLQKTYSVKPEDYHMARNKILQRLDKK